MKKFLAAFAAVAVIGAACFAVIQSNNNKENVSSEAESSTQVQANEDISGYSSATVSSTEEFSASSSSVSTENTSKKSFTGEIDVVNGMNIILVPEKSSKEYSSGRISVSLSGLNAVDSNGKTVKPDDYKNFSKAAVYYDGNIMETYPPQVNAEKVVFLSREKCNIYFEVDGTIVKTICVDVGADIDSSDMPNAGAACKEGTHFNYWTVNGEKVTYLSNVRESVTVSAEISKD